MLSAAGDEKYLSKEYWHGRLLDDMKDLSSPARVAEALYNHVDGYKELKTLSLVTSAIRGSLSLKGIRAITLAVEEYNDTILPKLNTKADLDFQQLLPHRDKIRQDREKQGDYTAEEIDNTDKRLEKVKTRRAKNAKANLDFRQAANNLKITGK